MKIKMINLYGIDDVAWYQKVGKYCFQMVAFEDQASELTLEEAEDILKDKDWYCMQYNAEDMCIV